MQRSLECELEVRTYILIEESSRWKRKGEPVIVHCPAAFEISTTAKIPAKRDGENSICFLSPVDIEPELSPVYKNLNLTRGSSWIHAHGVAMQCSIPQSSFEYQSGDLFWIYIGSDTGRYGADLGSRMSETSVHVINLRTFQDGDISIDHVCWWPHVEGPRSEIWTLGGDIRVWKQAGSKNFSYWSWVICQSPASTMFTTKSVEIPTGNVKLADRHRLSETESQFLFDKKYQYMNRFLSGLLSPPNTPSDGSLSGSLSRSMTPFQELSSISSASASQRKPEDVFINIVGFANAAKRPYRLLRPSIIHTTSQLAHSRLLPISHRQRSMKEIPYNDRGKRKSDDELPGHPAAVSSMMEQRQTTKRPPAMPDFVGMRGKEIDAAFILQTMSTNVHVPEHYALRCSERNSNCKYNFKSTVSHRHIPAEECRLENHEHCVLSLGPFSRWEATCLLSNPNSLEHKCCDLPADKQASYYKELCEANTKKWKYNKKIRYSQKCSERFRLARAKSVMEKIGHQNVTLPKGLEVPNWDVSAKDIEDLRKNPPDLSNQYWNVDDGLVV